MKTLKERVLERCVEIHSGMDAGEVMTRLEDLGFKVYNNCYILSGNIFTIQIDKNVPESDPVWPLAASVLGIKEDGGEGTKTENDYLSALKTLIVGSCRAMDDDRLSEAVYNHVSPFFLSIVRSVPNKEDRELVKNHFFSVGILNGNTPDNVIAAFKRLCGLEVGNGG